MKFIVYGQIISVFQLKLPVEQTQYGSVFTKRDHSVQLAIFGVSNMTNSLDTVNPMNAPRK